MKFLSKFSLALILTVLAAGGVGVLATYAQTPPANSSRPARVHAKVEGFDLSSQTGKAPNQIGGASRDIGGSPALYAPAMAKAFSTRPTFYWSAGDEAQKVEFQLMSDKGATIFESSVTGNHFTYPADAPSLAPGAAYRWTVKPENDLMGGPPAPADFVIVGGNERLALAGELAAAGDVAAKAKVLFDHRIWYDALSSYTDAIAAHPDRKDLLRDRAMLYDQVPATYALADRDIAAAN
jgi:Domain of Unknown Function (DUF928)